MPSVTGRCGTGTSDRQDHSEERIRQPEAGRRGTPGKHRYGETGEATPVGNVLIELGHLSEEHLIAAKKIFKIREQQKKRLKKSKKRRTPSH